VPVFALTPTRRARGPPSRLPRSKTRPSPFRRNQPAPRGFGGAHVPNFGRCGGRPRGGKRFERPRSPAPPSARRGGGEESGGSPSRALACPPPGRASGVAVDAGGTLCPRPEHPNTAVQAREIPSASKAPCGSCSEAMLHGKTMMQRPPRAEIWRNRTPRPPIVTEVRKIPRPDRLFALCPKTAARPRPPGSGPGPTAASHEGRELGLSSLAKAGPSRGV